MAPTYISIHAQSSKSKFTKLKYFMILTCSHGGMKVKINYMLQIYIVGEGQNDRR